MELTLNLIWMLLATLMFWLWLRHARRDGVSRKTQLLALAVGLLIIFPVISVTDDLLEAQNFAETASCQRKDHVCSNAHLMPHSGAEFTLPVFADPGTGLVRPALPGHFFAQRVNIPAMESIQNRPPPAA